VKKERRGGGKYMDDRGTRNNNGRRRNNLEKGERREAVRVAISSGHGVEGEKIWVEEFCVKELKHAKGVESKRTFVLTNGRS